MSCGDGANDLQLVANSGIGIAMGNAVPMVSFISRHGKSSVLSWQPLPNGRHWCYTGRQSI